MATNNEHPDPGYAAIRAKADAVNAENVKAVEAKVAAQSKLDAAEARAAEKAAASTTAKRAGKGD